MYKELAESLSKVGIKQLIYIPLRKYKEFDINIDYKIENTDFIYSKVFSITDRISYTRKINKMLHDIKNKVCLKNINLVHAHFLFLMGGVALKLKEEKNINYIVTVRNSDVNRYFKYRFHLRKMGINIMENAKKIFFVSPSYKKFVINRYVPHDLKEYINQKSVVVQNGVNSFWLQNKYIKYEYKDKKKINLLYVGEFTKNKNIDTSIKVAKKLKVLGYNVNFTIVGGGGNYEYKLKRLAMINKDIIKIYDRVKDREKLLNIYRKSNIFIMLSFHETFGLVYIEAMSQGVPIIYTKGQGIDGYFDDGTVGFSVNPKDINNIVEKIEIIIRNYNRISENCYKSVGNFSWNKIAKIYHNLYTSLF